MRPGDVLTIYGGTTVEVLNTDAEGRLVLADGLARAVEQKPDVIIDVATLTGHMVMALGDQGAARCSAATTSSASLVEAGRETGEKHWPMPIPPDIVERVHGSKIADLAQHDWTRWGGGLFAAAFLREFTGDLPVGPPRHRRPGLQHRRRQRPPDRRGHGLRPDHAGRLRPRALSGRFVASAADVLPHPLRDADHAGLVGRDAAPLAELVGPVGRRHPAAGELAVPGHQQQRHVADRRARLDEALDALAGRR